MQLNYVIKTRTTKEIYNQKRSVANILGSLLCYDVWHFVSCATYRNLHCVLCVLVYIYHVLTSSRLSLKSCSKSSDVKFIIDCLIQMAMTSRWTDRHAQTWLSTLFGRYEHTTSSEVMVGTQRISTHVTRLSSSDVCVCRNVTWKRFGIYIKIVNMPITSHEDCYAVIITNDVA